MASRQQQAGGAPEDAWIPFIQSMYPDLLQTTHFFPPLFFNRVPHTVETVSGEAALVRTYQQQQPSTSSQPSASASPQSSSPAGTVFTDIPSGLQVTPVQESDLRDDKAQSQCLQALRDIKEKGMMVISQMMFKKYLDNKNNPQQHVNPTNIIISQLPSISSIPLNIADGECDIIILHRQYGILVGEVKSVGGGPYLSTQSLSDQNKSIAKVVTKAIKQLDNQEFALKHLVHDMAGGNIRVTKAPLLPNITSAQLTAAVNSDPQLQVALCRSTGSNDVTQAVSRCLCADHLPQPEQWWNAVWTVGTDPSMTDRIYERLVARFCGPASTVDIPTAGHPRKVLRAFGEAVAETALRFVSLVLTLQQVALLNRQPEPQYLYLQGPPGTGKTVVLVLKALQWLMKGKRVIVISQFACTALTILVEEQLARMLGTAATPAGSIQRHSWDMRDINKDVSGLVQLLGPGNPEAFILFDEVPRDSDKFFQCLTAVQHRLPSVRVWAASVHIRDNDPTRPPPSWLEICTVTEPLRSPPEVTRQVEESDAVRHGLFTTPQYSAPALPLPTEGPPVRRLRHRRQAGHSGGGPWQCALCADTIGQLLSDLRVGQPGAPQYRDTWILCSHLPDARDAEVVVRRLSGPHGVPVRAVPCPPSAADARDLALALTDQVIVTDYNNVQGMERTVVIVLRGFGIVDDCLSVSRSTSFLCVID